MIKRKSRAERLPRVVRIETCWCKKKTNQKGLDGVEPMRWNKVGDRGVARGL